MVTPIVWELVFTEVSLGVGDAGCALATAFSDFDGDADPDILVANDFGEWVASKCFI